MNRLKALYRSWGFRVPASRLCAAPWCGMACEDLRGRRTPSAGILLQQFDALRPLRREVRRELFAERKKHPATKLSARFPGSVRSGRRC